MLSCNFGPGNSQQPVPETARTVLAGWLACFWLDLEAAVEALFLQCPQAIISLHPALIHNRRPTWLR